MKNRKKLGRVLAEGEVTGHAHRVEVDVFEGVDGTREFEGATTVTHEEHKPVSLEPKEWASGPVREFDHLLEEARQVRD